MAAFSLTLVLLVLSLAHSARSFHTQTIPLNWTTVSTCAIDNPARIIAGDITTQATANTPAACVESCAAQGFGYAGVEFGNECHCGSGLVGTLQNAPASDCNMACSGNGNFSCGGAWRIQVYSFPALRPGSWAYQGCIADSLAAPAFTSSTTHTFSTNLDLVNQCLQACSQAGATFAAVEDAGVCQCSGSAPVPAAQKVAETACNSLCPLPGNAGFEFCGGVNALGVYKLVG
ncbi:WSC-domain-containing protein [Trametes coccinea BRFM310]|uniref:WSC-domain-containing protein n=1 Tax=Trametes coccinea (strain BRFM310) TaxID=1353009 RepID=A0A1Y2I5H9_TRAC3|nr:WSC-domain-containing protein [Trametes coccinea BRFM310]